MKILVTGCCGLVGSAVIDHFASSGHSVVGIDNDGRREFFGDAGSTAAAGRALEDSHGSNFRLHQLDVRDTAGVFELFEHVGPFDAVIHCAAQPAHDWAAAHPLDDFHVNAFGTLKVLEACRQHCAEAPFVFMSTNKVYGAEVCAERLVELDTRFDFTDIANGVPEGLGVDQCTRSIYGAGKLAADIYVQEYGLYYGMPTVCIRAGCITGAGHAAVPLHGFLSYLVKCNVSGQRYIVKGYGGKQVRDNLHAADLAQLIWMMIERPPEPSSVYNVGGGKPNSCSILEAFNAVGATTGKPMIHQHDPEPRRGDHACYYTDLRKVMGDYPAWRPTRDLPSIFSELVEDWRDRGYKA